MTAASTAAIAEWRKQLKADQRELRARFETNFATARLLKLHSDTVDALLRKLWQHTDMPAAISLVAVGGYGRRELFPHSDVDLLILLPNQHDGAMDAALEALVGLFWDIGLAVGHSVRTLDECLAESANDVTVRTNLLEARWLAGNRELFRSMCQHHTASIDPAEFLQQKTLEQQHRHARYHDTAYNLEPNVKESPGGLRDLQNIIWISKGCGLGDSWESLAQQGLITQTEARQIRRQELFVQMLRIRLHYLADRREDRLLFDHQHALAAQLGFKSSHRKRASEKLMQRYYRSAKFIELMNEILLQSLREHLSAANAPITFINPRFHARNNRLEASHPDLLRWYPQAILESFLLLQQHPELEGFSASMLRAMLRAQRLIDRDFLQQEENRKLFMQILRQPSGITSAFRRMNRYGILGRYIPAFGRIVGQMQHDLFHVYTVDEHILNVLRNLRRFTLPEHAHEFPLCSRLLEEFGKPELLYLAALFHDIAKGRGGDHSQLGMRDAKRFCMQHGLPQEDTQFVTWLVQQHLVMSSTAQKSDLNDPAVIEDFSRRMVTERRLTALYLLTVADIRGTSPAIWNAWKAKLLEHLFLSTQRQLRGNAPGTEAELAGRMQEAEAKLSYYIIMPESYRELWSKLGKRYFLRHESHEIVWHTRMLLTHTNAPTPIVRARLSPGGDGIQVMIYSRDQSNLFARICGFFERAGYGIVEAKIHTTRHGYALDSFLVLDENDYNVRYRDLLSYIEYELTAKLSGSQEVEQPIQGRVNRQLKHFPIAPSIQFSEKDARLHQLDVIAGDRPGLLSRIAQTLLKHRISLHSAKINTLGGRAEDTFLISAQNGEKLSEAEVQIVAAELADLLK